MGCLGQGAPLWGAQHRIFGTRCLAQDPGARYPSWGAWHSIFGLGCPLWGSRHSTLVQGAHRGVPGTGCPLWGVWHRTLARGAHRGVPGTGPWCGVPCGASTHVQQGTAAVLRRGQLAAGRTVGTRRAPVGTQHLARCGGTDPPSVTASPRWGQRGTPHSRGDGPYPAAGASRRGTRCPWGRHRRGTGSARGPGRRRWRGDSSAPCRHSTRPAGTRTRSSPRCPRDVPPRNVPLCHPPYLGHGAAAPGAAGRHAASGIVGTLGLSVGTGDGTRGCGERGRGEGPPPPPRPTRVPPPRRDTPVPGDTTQDSPSAPQWDPRGQQRWPPAQGTPWGERMRGGGGETPPKWRREGGN